MSKNENAYKTISEVARILELKSKNNGKLQTHTIRFWEKEFKQIKPKKINNRRYYSSDQVEIVRLIHFLIKNKGLTTLGVKNVLNSNINKLDDYNSHSLKADYYKERLKNKSLKLLDKIKKFKNNGKKNTY